MADPKAPPESSDEPKRPTARPRGHRKAAPKKATDPDESGGGKSPTAETGEGAAPRSKPRSKKEPEVRVPHRPTLSPTARTHLGLRRVLDRRRPIFGRQAANRYWRIGRDGAWRRPRGLQSKQRRHYGYRAKVVRVGYRSPADVRGLTPSGYRPILVHHADDLARIDPKLEAAIIARTVGTRRRLGLEETARKLGIRVLNPIATPGEE